jgi:ferredoxin
MVVLDENDCMVDIARYFLEFTQQQSCGRCTFCRVGTKRMLEILERLCLGQGKPDDIDKLKQLAVMIQTTSLCGLGKTAPNPVLSTLEHFLDEYRAHIEGRCPAGKCRAMIQFSVTDDCIGCTLCAQKCPVEAIAFAPYEKHTIDPQKCIRCGACKSVCPADAVEVK